MGAMPTLVVGMLVLELAEHAHVNVGMAPETGDAAAHPPRLGFPAAPLRKICSIATKIMRQSNQLGRRFVSFAASFASE